VAVLNDYLETVLAPIRAHGGVVNTFIGDGLFASFNMPLGCPDHAAAAVRAAIDIQRAVGARVFGDPGIALHTRIGISTGPVIAGSVGAGQRLSFTLLGDTVNLASRLETANKLYGSHALVSDATARAAEGAIELREIDRLFVAGQSQPQTLFEIMGVKGGLSEPQALLRSRYAEGLAAYRARRFDDARGSFNAALASAPADGPSMALLQRIDGLQASPPPSDWDGAWPVGGG
jgi:adenylate cyclase